MDEFLAEDFARVGNGPIDRCMKIEGQRLYLSGATGFFGKNLLSLLAYLHRQGASFQVTALSRSPNRFLSEQPWCRRLPWLNWEEGSVSDPWPGDGEYDLLLHAATDTNTSSHQDKPQLFEQIIAATRHALNFAAFRRVKRVLLTGSGAQYGAIPGGTFSGVAETSLLACDPTKCSSAYGEGKRLSELLAALYADRDGFEVVNTRCFAFLGPGLPIDGHFAVGNFLRDALSGAPIRLASAGTAVRSYLYGADLAVWLMVLLLESENGSAVNIGSDQAVSIIELATRVRDAIDRRVPIQKGEPRPKEEREFYVPSIERARSLGLSVWTDLDHAIARTASWHRASPRFSFPSSQ